MGEKEKDSNKEGSRAPEGEKPSKRDREYKRLYYFLGIVGDRYDPEHFFFPPLKERQNDPFFFMRLIVLGGQ